MGGPDGNLIIIHTVASWLHVRRVWAVRADLNNYSEVQLLCAALTYTAR